MWKRLGFFKSQEAKDDEAQELLKQQIRDTENDINQHYKTACLYRQHAHEAYGTGSLALAVSFMQRARVAEKGCELLAKINVNSEMILTARHTMKTLNMHVGRSKVLLGSKAIDETKIDKAHEVQDGINQAYSQISDLFTLFGETTTSTITSTSAIGDAADTLEDEWKTLTSAKSATVVGTASVYAATPKPKNTSIQAISQLYVKARLAPAPMVPNHDPSAAKKSENGVHTKRVLRYGISH